MSLPIIIFEGHLSLAKLRGYLARMEAAMTATGHNDVIVDVSRMGSYDGEARSQFGEWLKSRASARQRVAVVTTSQMYRAVIGVMALMSSTKIRAFARAEAAQAWLGENQHARAP